MINLWLLTFTQPCRLPQLCVDCLSSHVLHLHFPFPPTPNLCSPPLFLNLKAHVKAFFFPLYPVICFDVRLNPGGFGGLVLVDHSNLSFTLEDSLAKTPRIISSYLPFSAILPYLLHASTHRWNVANWRPQHRNTQQELHSCRRDPAAAGMRAPKSHFRAARWVSELTFLKLVCGAQRVLRQCAPGSATSHFYDC